MIFVFPVHHVLCSIYADFIQGLFKENENNRTQSFNFKFRNIDDVISLNKFDEKRNTTDTAKSTSYIDLHFDIDNEGPLRTKCYDKRDDFNNYIVSFRFDVFVYVTTLQRHTHISQLIRYSRACVSYDEYLMEAYYWRWSSYRLNCLYWLRWSHILESFTVTTMTWLIVTNEHGYLMFLVQDYCRVGNKSSTSGATYWTGTTYPCGAPKFTPGVM